MTGKVIVEEFLVLQVKNITIYSSISLLQTSKAFFIVNIHTHTVVVEKDINGKIDMLVVLR